MQVGAPTIELNDGHRFPELGLGTYGLNGDEGTAQVQAAIASGYRLLDTALNYGNEDAVGRAVRESGVDREDLVVTTKLPGRHHGYDEAHRSIDESLANLGLDHVDMYLIHWPNPSVDKFVDTWKAFVDLRDAGKVRSIGVSNFTPDHLKRIVDATGVAPAVNQVELHPYFPQAQLRKVHQELGIVTESWSPLAKQSELMSEPAVVAAAEAHGVTPGQVVLRWHVQLGAVPVPKSGDPERQRQNLDVFGFELTDDEVRAISALERGRLWDGDPDTHEEM
ncbi:diketogulonate reductase-like aldo/keto reductase [Curtobacterium luteum]|uniref:Diketogulonate reductase-like aldo/keto reductase n=1 Tax=Curtobacterium luteum TaxID=33881 RepID=A0A8H9G9W2_9MICO|nr:MULTISPECIES: aldo/keto reductase [Curtobacterium]MBM7800999.1 diketogulonate reductase-like aldo/keto reductase [Curtobacterium luteum]NUU50942.1 aldo/keto reductase [Curtobacterium luteum]GGL06202.1 oxidoreductase [Curtobacterium luteum]